MKITSADGVQGILLNPYHSEGKWVFRVTHDNGTFTDYDLEHSDLCITIHDSDAFLYKDPNGPNRLDHSPATLGKTGE